MYYVQFWYVNYGWLMDLFTVLLALQGRNTGKHYRAPGVLCCLNSTCHNFTNHHASQKHNTRRALFAFKYLMFTIVLGWHIDLRLEYVTVL